MLCMNEKSWLCQDINASQFNKLKLRENEWYIYISWQWRSLKVKCGWYWGSTLKRNDSIVLASGLFKNLGDAND